MKNKPTAGMIAILLGVLLVLIPIVIFPVCHGMIELTNGKMLFMKCHWTARAEVLLGMLIICNGILTIVFKKHETRIALGIMLFLFGLAALLIPTAVIGMCESSSMACRVGTEPALIVMSVIIMLAGIGNVVSQLGLMRSERHYKERSVNK